jgi:DNA-binding transcriptional regulator GbsR (MarR family)
MKVSKNWNLMATHGVVLFYIAGNPDSTMRQMAESLNLTERRIAQVVRDLSDAGLLSVTRNGRRNAYSVNPDASFRHPTLAHITLGRFVQVLSALPLAVGAVLFGLGEYLQQASSMA